MKTKQGFVSNSSSSSFIIPKEGLTPFQRFVIENHSYVAEAIRPLVENQDGEYFTYPGLCDYCKQGWEIQSNETDYLCSTFMDNFLLMTSYLYLIFL